MKEGGESRTSGRKIDTPGGENFSLKKPVDFDPRDLEGKKKQVMDDCFWRPKRKKNHEKKERRLHH